MARAANGAVLNDALLPDGKSRWGSFGAGFGLEFIAVTVIVILPMLMPQKLDAVRRYWVTPLEAPHIEAWKPQPQPKPVPVKREVVKEIPKPEEVVPPKPKIYNPVITASHRQTRDSSEKLARAGHDASCEGISRSSLSGQFGDPHIEETARGGADGRIW